MQDNPEFSKEFYDFGIGVDDFLDMGVTEDAFISALTKHFPEMTRA